MPSHHPAIRVSHLCKKYQIGGPQEPNHTFRDAMVNSVKAPFVCCEEIWHAMKS